MIDQPNAEPGITISADHLNFWIDVLQATQDSQSNPSVIFPLLQANRDKLDDRFIYLFDYWITAVLPTLTPEQAIALATIMVSFSDLMQQFSPSNRAIAIAGYDAALAVFNQQDFSQQWLSIQINRAIAYRNHQLGDRAENLEQAIIGYQNALQGLNQSDTPETWALVRSNLAVAYIDRLRGERAENLELALACCQNALKVYSPQTSPLDWAMAINNLAVAYRARIHGNRSDNLEAALTCYQQALQVYTRGQLPRQWATTQSNLGNAYRNRLKGDPAENLEQAISCCKQALEVLTKEESPEDWARTQHYLGNAYRNRIRGSRASNLDQAITVYRLALQVYQRDVFAQDWALTLNDLALAYVQLFREKEEAAANDLEQAILCCEQALQVLTFKAFPEQRARTLNTLGLAYTIRLYGDRSENLDRAISCYNEALQFYTYETLPEQWARTCNNLGNALREHSHGNRWINLEQAITIYQQALRVYTPTTFPQNYIKTQWGIGSTYWKLRQLKEAYTAFQNAIERLEFLRSEIVSGDSVKQKLAEEWNGLYQDMVSLCLELSAAESPYLIQALEYVERSKARTLVELLSQQELLPKGEIPHTVMQELQALRRALATEERSLQMSETEDYSRFDQLRQQLDHFVEVNIKPIDPTFSATQKVDAIEFTQIQALLNETTAALVWYVTEQDCFTWIITHRCNIPQIIRLEREERNALREWVNYYFQRYLQNKPDWKATLAEQLQLLSKILHLQQILKLIPEDCNQLLLVPHRFLHLLPLHALPIKNLEEEPRCSELSQQFLLVNEALLDRFPEGVSYAPSFQALQLAQRRQRPNFSQFVGVQNPTGDLSYADVEVSVVGQGFQPTAKILMGDAAQKNAVSAAFQGAHCSHFACHGYFDFEFPLKSALVLAGAVTRQSEQDEEEKQTITDSMGGAIALEKCLTLGEIFGLSLEQCRLVTLSACETGLTDFRSLTDEYIGLPSGFLYAGSPSVVSSLWAVNDISTALLMIKFYENLPESSSVAVALNQAQRWLRDSTGDALKQWIKEKTLLMDRTQRLYLQRRFQQAEKPFHHPVYWSSFYSIG